MSQQPPFEVSALAGSVRTAAASPRCVYFAGPIVEYGSERRSRARVHLLARLGDEDLFLDPELMFVSTPSWLTWWPRLLPIITEVALLPASDATIGIGCWKEVLEARNEGLTVYLVDAAGRRAGGAWSMAQLRHGSSYRFARVRRTRK